MSVEPHRRISIEDYLAAERQAETKSECLEGEVFAMSGASRVSQDEVRVELFTRREDGHWLLSEAGQLDETIPLASIGCELRLADVYERVIDLPR